MCPPVGGRAAPVAGGAAPVAATGLRPTFARQKWEAEQAQDAATRKRADDDAAISILERNLQEASAPLLAIQEQAMAGALNPNDKKVVEQAAAAVKRAQAARTALDGRIRERTGVSIGTDVPDPLAAIRSESMERLATQGSIEAMAAEAKRLQVQAQKAKTHEGRMAAEMAGAVLTTRLGKAKEREKLAGKAEVKAQEDAQKRRQNTKAAADLMDYSAGMEGVSEADRRIVLVQVREGTMTPAAGRAQLLKLQSESRKAAQDTPEARARRTEEEARAAGIRTPKEAQAVADAERERQRLEDGRKDESGRQSRERVELSRAIKAFEDEIDRKDAYGGITKDPPRTDALSVQDAHRILAFPGAPPRVRALAEKVRAAAGEAPAAGGDVRARLKAWLQANPNASEAEKRAAAERIKGGG